MSFQPRDPSVVAIIQARMGSSRLPGKVLKKISGEPMLFHVVVRARQAQGVGQVVVATTTDESDDPVFEFCRRRGIPCYRGDPYDVLDRYYQAAKLYEAGIIVRLTGDCPLIDPQEVDRTIRAFFDAGVDFAANRLPPPWKRTTPIGMDTEVATFDALSRAWREAQAKYEREHVMPYLYDQPGRFSVLLADHDPDFGRYRLAVDTQEDLELIRNIFNHFGGTQAFAMRDIIELLEEHPEWLQINAAIQHKSFTDIDDRS
jgi:spore coat polysaccharide biosynthesis protein SpsF